MIKYKDFYKWHLLDDLAQIQILVQQQIFGMEQPEQLDYQIYRDYQILGKVGKGTYGVVYKAVHKKTQRIIAIKKIIDAFQNLIDAKRTYRELNYLLQMDHPCIVRLEHLINMTRKGPFHEPSTTRLAVPPFDKEERGSNTDKLFSKMFPQQRHVYAVFQFIETDLSCALQKCAQLQPIQRKYIAYQLLHGISYLHRSGLIHRDIKPSNLLLNCNKLQLKICDFGMARLKITNETINDGVLTEYVASRWYRPPQSLLGITTCQEAIDLWSVGCVIAELILKVPLFPGKSTLDQLQLILKSIGMPSPQQIQKLPSEQAQYVLKNFAFSKKCKYRPLQDTLSSCSNQQLDLIMNLLKFDPAERITAEQALSHDYFNQIRQLDNNLQMYNNSSNKIMDLSVKNNIPQSQQRNNNNPGIDHYRALIQELQKFGERSTNRSGFTQHFYQKKNGQVNHLMQQIVKNQSKQKIDFKQKSTKQSDFVYLQKQHYLHAYTSQIVQNENKQQEKKNNKPIQKIAKPSKQKSKSKGQKSSKILKHQYSSKGIKTNLKEIEYSFKPAKHKTNPLKKISRTGNEGKQTNKQRQRKQQIVSEIKKQLNNYESRGSMISKDRKNKLMLQECEQSLIERKRKVLSQTMLIKPKSINKNIDSQSIMSNYSTHSLHKPSSRQKCKIKPNHSQQINKLKMEQIQKLGKVGDISKKTILVKSKSTNFPNHFKRKA